MSDRRRKMIAALRAEHALDGDTVFLAAAEMSSKCHKRTYAPGLQTLIYCLPDHLDHPHHSFVLMIHGVAVIDEPPDNCSERNDHLHQAVATIGVRR